MSNYMMKLARKEVAAAARAMDKEYGRIWPFLINLEDLDLTSTYNCVLAQVEKMGIAKKAAHAGIGQWPERSWTVVADSMAKRYGVELITFASSSSEYLEVWKKEIQKRLDKNK